jgi:hypothetical protein
MGPYPSSGRKTTSGITTKRHIIPHCKNLMTTTKNTDQKMQHKSKNKINSTTDTF